MAMSFRSELRRRKKFACTDTRSSLARVPDLQQQNGRIEADMILALDDHELTYNILGFAIMFERMVDVPLQRAALTENRFDR